MCFHVCLYLLYQCVNCIHCLGNDVVEKINFKINILLCMVLVHEILK